MRDVILKNNTTYIAIVSDYHLVAIFFIRQTFLLENRPQDESLLEVASPQEEVAQGRGQSLRGE